METDSKPVQYTAIVSLCQCCHILQLSEMEVGELATNVRLRVQN